MKNFIEEDKLFYVEAEGEKHIDLPVVEKICRSCIRGEGAESVTVPNGVKIISDMAFSNSNLKKVTLPSSAFYVGKYLFSGIENDVFVEISSLITGIATNAFVPSKGAKIVCKIENDHLSLPEDFTINLLTVVGTANQAPAVEGGVVLSDGSVAIVKKYTKSEYLAIKKEALKYMPTFNNSGNYYVYSNDDREEYCGTAFYALPFVPDDQILVKDGQFIGMAFDSLVCRESVCVPVYKGSDKFVLMYDNSYSDEWGYHGNSNYCKLTFVGCENPREVIRIVEKEKK